MARISDADAVSAALGDVELLTRKGATDDDPASSSAAAAAASSCSAVFVDDSIAELLDHEVAAVPNLTRVLFSRVLA